MRDRISAKVGDLGGDSGFARQPVDDRQNRFNRLLIAIGDGKAWIRLSLPVAPNLSRICPETHLSPFLQKCRIAKARPDPDLRYCSNFAARTGSRNAIATRIPQGRPLLEDDTIPALCAANRSVRSSVMPV